MPLTPLTAADAGLLELCQAGLDLAEDANEAATILRRLADPPVDRRVVGFGARSASGDLLGAALGSLDRSDETIGHLDLLVVRPDARRVGLGRELLSTVESALAVAEMRLSGNPPCYAWPGIDVRYTPAICLAEAAGYERVRTAWNMTAPLAALPTPGELPDVTLRRATPEDLPALLPWISRTWNEVWEWEVSESVGRPDAGCHLALRDGTPIGFAAWGALRPSVFGPMGTDPAARGSGIGRSLLLRCLLDQRAFGLDRAQIGWVGPVPFYADASGAFIERVFFLYQKAIS